MNGRHSAWGHAIVGLVAALISLKALADLLPRLVPYFVVLAVMFVVVRLVIFHTRRW